jgi:hypothetical protein
MGGGPHHSVTFLNSEKPRQFSVPHRVNTVEKVSAKKAVEFEFETMESRQIDF